MPKHDAETRALLRKVGRALEAATSAEYAHALLTLGIARGLIEALRHETCDADAHKTEIAALDANITRLMGLGDWP